MSELYQRLYRFMTIGGLEHEKGNGIIGRVIAVVFVGLLMVSMFVGVVSAIAEASSTINYEPVGTLASFSVHGVASAWSTNDTITRGLQLVQYKYGLSVYNLNNDTVLGNLEYTLQADNIVDVYDKEYADWNDSYVKWVFPSNYSLAGDDWLWTGAESSSFETKYIPMSISRRMNKSIFDADGYQLAEFDVTFADMNFDYFGGHVKTAYGDEEQTLVNASFLPETFSTDAPLFPLRPFSKKDAHHIEFNLDKTQLQANKTYKFSVVVRVDLKGDNPSPILYKPCYSIWLGFNSSCTTCPPGPIGKNVTMPSEMLPEHIHYASASTNVSNTWCLCGDNQLVISLNEISESELAEVTERKISEKSTPGFEAIFAIAGLLAVAYLFRKRRMKGR